MTAVPVEQHAEFTQQVLDEADTVAIPAPSDSLVTLPGGWIAPNGSLCRKAEIRELTGADEEALSRCTTKGRLDLAKFMRTVLERGLVSIESHSQTSEMLDSLLIGDRDAVLLAVRMATYGNEYQTTITCRECGQDSEVVFELDNDIDSKELADPETWWRTVELRNGRQAIVHLVTVVDQTVAIGDATRTVAEINTVLLGRVIKSIDGQDSLGEQTARQLGAGDRRILEKFLVDKQPGPQMGEVKGVCPACNADITVALSMPALFL